VKLGIGPFALRSPRAKGNCIG